MITYNIELHDITTLTEPMFHACGLECPAMIGGTCRKDSGEFCTLPKFTCAAAEVVHSWTMDSQQSEDIGSTDERGWFALFRNPDTSTHATDAMRAGVILLTDSQGYVCVERHDTAVGLESAWADALALYPEDDESECEGHYDDDATLLSGAGIGEPTYCDGSCTP